MVVKLFCELYYTEAIMWSKIYNEDIEISEELKKEYGATEFYDLGRIRENKIEKVDKGVAYDLKEVLACVIRDYLRLYNKVNLNANYPTVYHKALYSNEVAKEDWLEQTGGPEELDKWTELVEEVAKQFDKLLNDWNCENQEVVDLAFDSLKKIFLGLWT